MTSVVLIIAFGCYILYNARNQHSIFDEVIELDEHHDLNRENNAARMRYTETKT